MKVRSTQELVDQLDQSRQRRKRELVALRTLLSATRPMINPLWPRTAVVLAYAHWEGFIKLAASAYISYLSTKSVSLASLNTNFQALVCRAEVQVARSSTKRIAAHLGVVRRLVDDAHKSVTIPNEGVIDTESNLNWVVFDNICQTIGIDASQWAQHRALVDELVKLRCAISHGEELTPPSEKQAIEYTSFVISAMDSFSTAIENAAILGSHLRGTSPANAVLTT